MAADPNAVLAADAAPLVRICASEDRLAPRLADLWSHRELLYFLTWRDIKIRYKQTLLGAAWAVLQPTLTMAVFALFFGRLARIPSDGIPYPVFAFCALLPWQLFAHALSSSANSLVTNERLVTKVYFPRLVLPIASVMSGLVDFGIAFLALLVLMAYYGMAPTSAVWALPLLVLMAVTAAVAVGLGLSALNVRFRDVRHVLPFLTQFWMFATPIAYPASLVPEAWRPIYGLNPMSGVVEGFRWALLGRDAPGPMLLVSAVVVVAGLALSTHYFLRVERSFADVL